MEELERSKFTRAGAIANERLIEAVANPDRYPEGTTFIAADQEGFGSILAEAVAEHRPLAIVYPDGREIVAASQRKSRRDPVVLLPADYQVEIRDRQPLAAA